MADDPQPDPWTPLVAHQPADHPYVRHISPPVRTAADRVDIWDPDAVVAAGVRIVHLHFGFETRHPHALRAWAADLRDRRVSLVHTVHDLDNPHLVDQTRYDEQLATIVHCADVVLTLTNWSADTVAERFGCRPSVIGHPHVVPLADLTLRRATAVLRRGVYIHASTVRPNLDIELIERITAAAPQIGGVLIHVRDTAVDASGGRQLVALADRPGVTVAVDPRLTDEQLWDRLQQAAVVVLPYRWGTHSGLLEAAHDLATPTAAPLVGAYAEQGAHPLRPDSIVDDLATAASATVGVDPAFRTRQARKIVDAHRRCYRALAAR